MDEKRRMIFSNNLKYYMRINGKKRSDLAKDLNFPYTSIRDWEKGICYAKLDKIEKIAKYFNIPTYKLIEDNAYENVLEKLETSEEAKLIKKIVDELPKLSKEQLEYILKFIKL